MNTNFRTCTSRVVPLLRDHVDTDQIIPARFLKGTDKSGLADALFADWRRSPDFVLNQPEHRGAACLLAAENFGCGSSREHAPWALLAGGFRVVLARSFADIFRNNALKNGLLPVALSPDDHASVVAAVEAEPSVEVTVDLERCEVDLPDRSLRFSVDSFGRYCLLEGIDQLEYLLRHLPAIDRHEVSHGY